MPLFQLHKSELGSFQELAHASDIQFGQLSLLKVNIGCTRGGHYHTRKHEWFACIRGKCKIEMVGVGAYRHSRVVELDASGIEFVEVMPYESHKVINTGDDLCELLVIISEPFDPENPDTIEYKEGNK